MKSFYIKQKFLSVHDVSHVYDENEEEAYTIEGSLIKVPKTYAITDKQGYEWAKIKRRTFCFMPAFDVEVDRKKVFTIRKRFAFFRSKFVIEDTSIEVTGNFWDMDFEVMSKDGKIAQVSKEWLTLGDTYHIEVLDEQWGMVIIALVVAIDRVKDEEHMLSTIFDIGS